MTVHCPAEGSASSFASQGTTSDLSRWNWFAPNRQVLGRWLTDAGFEFEDIKVQTRPNKRLLTGATKRKKSMMPDSTGFSRPSRWLVEKV